VKHGENEVRLQALHTSVKFSDKLSRIVKLLNRRTKLEKVGIKIILTG
jgi:hypothetical protein